MKTKVIIVALIVICVALCFGLISIKQEAEKQHKDDVDTIQYDSNQLVEVTGKLNDEKQNGLMLEKDLVARKEDIAKYSNDLSSANDSLAKTAADLKAAQEETAKRDAKITELENENTALDKQSTDLKTSITGLEGQIADTQKKLDTSEGDKAYLIKELARLKAEKDDLEHQFNDLTTLRTQVKKLKEELSLSRRLEWIREGIFARNSQKGAERLMNTVNAPQVAATNASEPATNVNLNVEVHSDGTTTIIPPITTNTPPPAATPPPGK